MDSASRRVVCRQSTLLLSGVLGWGVGGIEVGDERGR